MRGERQRNGFVRIRRPATRVAETAPCTTRSRASSAPARSTRRHSRVQTVSHVLGEAVDEDAGQQREPALERRLAGRITVHEWPLPRVHRTDAAQHALSVTRGAGAVAAVARDRGLLVAPCGENSCGAQIEVEVAGAPGFAKATDRIDDGAPEHRRRRRDDVPVEAEQDDVRHGVGKSVDSHCAKPVPGGRADEVSRALVYAGGASNPAATRSYRPVARRSHSSPSAPVDACCSQSLMCAG